MKVFKQGVKLIQFSKNIGRKFSSSSLQFFVILLYFLYLFNSFFCYFFSLLVIDSYSLYPPMFTNLFFLLFLNIFFHSFSLSIRCFVSGGAAMCLRSNCSQDFQFRLVNSTRQITAANLCWLVAAINKHFERLINKRNPPFIHLCKPGL